MKTLFKYILLAIIPVFIAGLIFTSCEKKDEGGKPTISYIRKMGNADSVITSAAKGSLIAIIGSNLGGAVEMWFNDQEAYLIPTYITDRSIIVTVPSTEPDPVTNKMKIIFNDGYELIHDFGLDPSGPEIYSIKCEYVPAGSTAYITGEFFYQPARVIFAGDVDGTVTSLTQQTLEVTVPEGATVGPIRVQTNFGIATSDFLFRDTTNVILDFDSLLHETWTAPIVYADSMPDPAPCSGDYITIVSDEVSAWGWENSLSMQYWAESKERNVPLAEGLVNDLIFRFEANVPESWYNVRMEIYMTIYGNGHGRDSEPSPSHARWMPWQDGPYTTDGWITMSIPLSEFTFHKDDAETLETGSNPLENNDLPILTNLTMMVFGPNDSGENYPVKICIDNIRIVPKP